MTFEDVILEEQLKSEKYPPTQDIPIVYLDRFSSTPELEIKYSKRESLGDRFRRLLFRTSFGSGVFLSGEAIEAAGSLHISDAERTKMESDLNEFAQRAFERARQARHIASEQAAHPTES